MARDYGRISTQFWKHPDVRELSSEAKLLAGYLLTCPHSNAIGAYLLPDAYIADDLKWSQSTVSKAFAELFKMGFCERFKDGRHICIIEYLAWNPIENPNVATGAKRALDQLPDDPALIHVFNGMKRYSQHFKDGWQTVAERFRNTEPFTEPLTDTEVDIARSANADEIAACFQTYNEVAEELGWSKAERRTDARVKKLRSRISECGGVAGWAAAMGKARASPFLRGETKRDKAHENWTPNLDFFLQQSTFTQLMEGKYDERFNPNQEPSGFDALCAGVRAAAAE